MSSTLPQETTATVLLIDDNSDDLRDWSNRLKTCSADYCVLTATSGKAALEVFDHQRIDCVVLDLDLPDSSGFELLFHFIADRTPPQIPVIVLTRLWNPTIHQLAVDHGALACFIKSRASALDLNEAIQRGLATAALNQKPNRGNLSLGAS
jgi:CheY-like chemotaxis protein